MAEDAKKTKKAPTTDAAPAAKKDAVKSEETKAAVPAAAATTTETAAPAAAKKLRRRTARLVPEGRIYIQATYNNTIITVTDNTGQVLGWTSAGTAGFKGTRKATPYAASVASETISRTAKAYGMERVHVFVSGVGSGREQAVRSLQTNGLNVLSIIDTTPLAHNGVRRPRVRRV